MKKNYKIPQDLVANINTTIVTAKDNIGTMNYRIVPLEAIEFDPENPRELCITRNDILNELDPSDPLYETKLSELESLQQMAETIKKFGVRNAVEIYQHGSNYRLLHGERRCLSSLIAGKAHIAAKILSEKPSQLDIRLLQLIENAQREDLSLYETLKNIRLVFEEYKKILSPNATLEVPLVEQLINKSRQQCSNIITVLKAPEKIQNLIKEGKIRSLEKAALIVSTVDLTQREELLDACLNGASLKQLKHVKGQSKKQKNTNNSSMTLVSKTSKPGKKASKIRMGETKNKAVVAKLVELVLNDHKYKHLSDNFKKFTFNDYDNCILAFKQLVGIMEKIEAA